MHVGVGWCMRMHVGVGGCMRMHVGVGGCMRMRMSVHVCIHAYMLQRRQHKVSHDMRRRSAVQHCAVGGHAAPYDACAGGAAGGVQGRHQVA